MELSVALDRIRKGIEEDGEEIIKAINDKVSLLESDNKLWKSRQAIAERRFEEIKKEVGDVSISELKKEIENNEKELLKLDSEKSELSKKLLQYEKEILYSEAAFKAGLNVEALQSLAKAGVIAEEIKIEGDEVKIGGVAIAEYLEKPERAWVKAALTNSTTKESHGEENKRETPYGGVSDKNKNDSDSVDLVLQQQGFKFPD